MFDLNYWQQRVARQTFIDTALIDGRPVSAVSGATFDAINPATNLLLSRVAACGENEVDLAVCSARQAFDTGPWRRLPPVERKKKHVKNSQLLMTHPEQQAQLHSRNKGKPEIRRASGSEIV